MLKKKNYNNKQVDIFRFLCLLGNSYMILKIFSYIKDNQS